MLDKFEHYCADEYEKMKKYLAESNLGSKRAILYIDASIKYCLGVAFFIQMEYNCDFKDVAEIYDKYKKKFENLIDIYK